MTVTELLPLGKRRSKVLTDEDFVFALYNTELNRLHIAEGTELSEALLKEELLPLLRKRAMERLLFLLKGRDYTEYALRRKLRESGIPECCAAEAILWAKERHYVDDRRYAEHYISCQSGQKGKRRIRAELLMRGVDSALADELLEQSPADEKEQIIAELRRCHFDPESENPDQKRRLVARLMRRGYSWGEIELALRSMIC